MREIVAAPSGLITADLVEATDQEVAIASAAFERAKWVSTKQLAGA
ncbi:hypothetical protein LJR220_001222 [Bradyrhizobium sp. LjRoot220]